MASRRALTGGTGDVNAQFISWKVSQTVTDATATLAVAVPIQRLSQGSGRAQVLEVLKVKYETNAYGGSNGTETQHRYAVDTSAFVPSTVNFQTVHSVTVALSTRNFATTTVEYSDPTVFSFYNSTRWGAFTAGGSYAIYIQEPYTDDLTDGAGHGFLVATDNIYIQISSVATNAPQACRGKLYYRWKNVSLQEYIGIVQGQQ
jgi:hypothetical protein